MDCYGKYYNPNTGKCQACDLADWCKNAGDIPLSHQVSYDQVDYGIKSSGSDDQGNAPFKERDAMWMALFRLVLEIDDYRIRSIIRLKVQDPDISLAQIASRFGVTKQAIGKDIQRIVAQFPELGVVLCNRPLYNRWRKLQLTHESPIFVRKRQRSGGIQLEFKFPRPSQPDLPLPD